MLRKNKPYINRIFLVSFFLEFQTSCLIRKKIIELNTLNS